jgi:hypothetical protein
MATVTSDPMPLLHCCDDPDACMRARMCLADPPPQLDDGARFRSDVRELMSVLRSRLST